MGDEVNLLLAAKAVNEKNIAQIFINHGERIFGIWHPPGYIHILAFLGSFLGVNELTARMVGIFCFLISLILIYSLSCELFKSENKTREIGLLACLIYTLNPLAIRGSLVTDIDGTVLNVTSLIFIYALIRTKGAKMDLKKILGPGVLLALVMWTKLSAPVIFIGSMLIYQSLRKNFSNVKSIINITLCAGFLFFLSWFLYSYLYNKNFFDIFYVPLSIIRGFFLRNNRIESLATIARNIWAVFIWCSPAFLILGIVSLIKIFKGKSEDRSLMSLKQFAFYSSAVSVIYVLVGGVTYSFPKYHFAMMPLFSILISNFLVKEIAFEKRWVKTMVILVILLVIFDFYLVADPLYTINYGLKEDIIRTNGQFASQMINKELIQILLILASIPLCFLFLTKKSKKAFLSVLFASMVSFNLALSFVQITADYNTVYCYGARGVRKTADFVRINTDPSKPIFAPQEIVWLGNKNLSSFYISGNSRNPDVFLRTIKDNNIQCVVYGITGNTIEQYKFTFNEKSVQQFLEDNFKLYEIGSYTIWFKK